MSIDKVIVEEIDMPDHVLQPIIKAVEEGCHKKFGKLTTLVTHIKRGLDSGPTPGPWHVIGGSNFFGSFEHDENSYVRLKVNDLSFSIFKITACERSLLK